MTKHKILITGTTKGLGKFLKENLEGKNDIFGVGKTQKSSDNFFNIDLTNFSLFDELIKKLEQENLIFDCVILNAGIGTFGRFEEIEENKIIEIINLNLLANVLLLYRLEKFLKKSTKIIFIGSVSSKKFFRYGAVYQASKFGLRGFAGALKNEWKDKKIYFLNPKILKTDFHSDTKIELKFEEKQYTKMEDILQVVQNILSGNEKRFEIDF